MVEQFDHSMKLHLSHSRIPASWIGPWIYLGDNYLVLRKWEERLSGNRQSLRMEIHNAAKKLRPDFLEWIERQRQVNQDSLRWWMSHLAGRDNTVSMLFLYICQIWALREWLRQHRNAFPELLVVCEDGFLLQTVAQNLAVDAKIHKVIGCHLGMFWDWCYWILRIGYGWLCESIHCWRYWRAARKSCLAPPDHPAGSVVLVHQCLDDKAFRNDEKLTDRYFTVLTAWLKGQGHRVVLLPWIFNVQLSLNEVYTRLRRDQCLVIQDYLCPSDYFGAFKNHLLSMGALKSAIFFPGMGIKPLVLRERLQQIVDVSTVRFWLYQPALRRWSRDIQSLLLIDTFEGMPPEHVQIKTLRESVQSFVAIGYYHILVSRDFLAYHSLAAEWQSSIIPDRIVTAGELGRMILVCQGAPPERVVSGPALRQKFNGQMPEAGKREGLLILLALDLECCVETVAKLSRHTEWIKNVLHIPVRLKPHPMMRREILLRKIGWRALPAGWEWTESEIYEALKTAHCCVAIGTASVYDAVVAGSTVLPLAREFGLMGNYLDLLEDEYEVARAVPDELIRQRLEEIFITRREYYLKEFSKIRTRLLDGLNPVNDELLQCFLPATFIRKKCKNG